MTSEFFILEQRLIEDEYSSAIQKAVPWAFEWHEIQPPTTFQSEKEAESCGLVKPYPYEKKEYRIVKATLIKTVIKVISK